MHLVHTNWAPQYTADCVQTTAQSSSRPGLRSADAATYVKPCTRTEFGDHGFRSAGPAAWNSLPDEMHRITDNDLFKCQLKTLLFSRTHYHEVLTERFFKHSILTETSCLHYLLPDKREVSVTGRLRHARSLELFKFRTVKFQNSFIPYCLDHYA